MITPWYKTNYKLPTTKLIKLKANYLFVTSISKIKTKITPNKKRTNPNKKRTNPNKTKTTQNKERILWRTVKIILDKVPIPMSFLLSPKVFNKNLYLNKLSQIHHIKIIFSLKRIVNIINRLNHWDSNKIQIKIFTKI